MKRTTKPKAKRVTKLKTPKPRKVSRSARDGRFVDADTAWRAPKTTVTETIRPPMLPILPLTDALSKADEMLSDERLPIEERLNWIQRCIKSMRHFVGG